MEPSLAIKQTRNLVAMRVNGSQRPNSSFYTWEIRGPERGAGVAKDHSLIGSKTRLEAKTLGRLGSRHGTSLQSFAVLDSCTFKMRLHGKVRAKSLSNLLREEEEMMGFIIAGITFLILFTG